MADDHDNGPFVGRRPMIRPPRATSAATMSWRHDGHTYRSSDGRFTITPARRSSPNTESGLGDGYQVTDRSSGETAEAKYLADAKRLAWEWSNDTDNECTANPLNQARLGIGVAWPGNVRLVMEPNTTVPTTSYPYMDTFPVTVTDLAEAIVEPTNLGEAKATVETRAGGPVRWFAVFQRPGRSRPRFGFLPRQLRGNVAALVAVPANRSRFGAWRALHREPLSPPRAPDGWSWREADRP